MADILIKNMEMPKDCRDCPLQIYYMSNGQTKCRVTGKILADFHKPIPFEGRAEECPIEIPKHGRWIKTVGENGVTSACRCSNCGFGDNRYSLFNYCPRCGARMDGE